MRCWSLSTCRSWKHSYGTRQVQDVMSRKRRKKLFFAVRILGCLGQFCPCAGVVIVDFTSFANALSWAKYQVERANTSSGDKRQPMVRLHNRMKPIRVYIKARRQIMQQMEMSSTMVTKRSQESAHTDDSFWRSCRVSTMIMRGKILLSKS